MSKNFIKLITLTAFLFACFLSVSFGSQDNKAQGTVTFVKEPSVRTVITIPENTLLKSESGVLFRTTKTVTLPVDKSTVSVSAEAIQPGPKGNIGSYQIVKCTPSIPGIGYVTNSEAFTGGEDEQTKRLAGLRLNNINFTPPSGTPDTLFKFFVTLYDPLNEAVKPGRDNRFIRIGPGLNEPIRELEEYDPNDKNYLEGKIFIYQTKLPPGYYNFKFGLKTVTGRHVESEQMKGPVVHKLTPPCLDLKGISITPPEAQLKTNDVINIGLEVKNIGESDMLSDYEARLWIDGQDSGIVLEGRLNAGRKHTRWAVKAWKATPGSHEIKIVLDVPDKSQVVDILNPIILRNIKLESPELTLSANDISFKPSPPEINQPTEISVKIHNIGNKEVPAGGVELIIYERLNGKWVELDKIKQDKAIPANSEKVFPKSLRPKPDKTYEIMVEIKPSAASQDSDTGNNSAIVRFAEVPGEARLSFHDDTQIAGDRKEGGTLYIIGDLHNDGNITSPDTTKVLLHVDDIYIKECDLGSIEPGKCKSFYFQWDCIPGGHKIGCMVSPGGGKTEMGVHIKSADTPVESLVMTDEDIDLQEIKDSDDSVKKVLIQGRIHNKGNSELLEGSYTVEIAVDPGKAGHVSLGKFEGVAIPPRGSVLFPPQAVEWIPSPGAHITSFAIKPKVGYDEEFCVRKFFNVTKVPSVLSITSINTSPRKVLMGDSSGLTATIRNIGTRASTGGRWEIREKDVSVLIASGKLPPIDPGSTTTLETEIPTSLLVEGTSQLELTVFSGTEATSFSVAFQIEVWKILSMPEKKTQTEGKGTTYEELSQEKIKGLLGVARARKKAWEESYEIHELFRELLSSRTGVEMFRKRLKEHKTEAIDLLVEKIKMANLSELTFSLPDILNLQKIWDFSEDFSSDDSEFVYDKEFMSFWQSKPTMDENFRNTYGLTGFQYKIKRGFESVSDVLSYYLKLINDEIGLLERLRSGEGDADFKTRLRENYGEEQALATALPPALDSAYLMLLEYKESENVSCLQVIAYDTLLRIRTQFEADMYILRCIRDNFLIYLGKQ
ncbi:MAG: hypothetical protein A2Z72_02015 [Omnitrophica bacterium RBG_13_46_9]|nr:MAG: hypothetical protein A2Z72_02015 [Omnitrophica bacterium RBG_13_46_9]